LPLPVAPPLMVIQATLLAAVQAQPLAVVTATDAVKPAAPPLADVADSDGAQVTPACVMVKVLPAIVSVPVRGVPERLAVPL
jgi:hypothetical protein